MSDVVPVVAPTLGEERFAIQRTVFGACVPEFWGHLRESAETERVQEQVEVGPGFSEKPLLALDRDGARILLEELMRPVRLDGAQ